jgi:hypothetical protein
MSFLRYIQGVRLGKEAHDIERESMEDILLYEAIDGFDLVDGDHTKRIKKIRKSVSKRMQNRTSQNFQKFSIAASILVVFGLGGYLLFTKDAPRVVDTPELSMFEEVVTDSVCSELTEENAGLLAQKESKQTKRDKPVTQPVVSHDLDIQAQKQSAVASNQIELREDEAMEESKLVDDGSKSKISVKVEVQEPGVPAPVIGKRAYEYYLERSIRSIDLNDESCNGGKGKVILLFHVNEKGRPYDVSVFRSLCQSADKEAIRLLNEGPDWTVGDKEVKLEINF